MVKPAMDVRRELGRLILDGLRGRSLLQLYKQLRQAFALAGEDVSLSAFYAWAEGAKFPANRKRQDLIAVVVGGPCGDAISKLPGPAFRGFRRRIATEEIHMKGAAHGGAVSGRPKRHIEGVSMVDSDGVRRTHPRITCVQCGASETFRGRRGKMDDDELFRHRGWDVGESAAHDYCPSCQQKARKVVKMEDHVKKTEPIDSVTNGAISREDGRILSRFIEDHWDLTGNRYLPGWSDVRLAEEVGRPIEQVKAIRERDFGGAGEDPLLTDFLAATVSVTDELGGLQSHMEGLAASVSELTSQHDKTQRLLEKYRDAHNALATKVKRITEVADQLRPFEKKATA